MTALGHSGVLVAVRAVPVARLAMAQWQVAYPPQRSVACFMEGSRISSFTVSLFLSAWLQQGLDSEQVFRLEVAYSLTRLQLCAAAAQLTGHSWLFCALPLGHSNVVSCLLVGLQHYDQKALGKAGYR